MNTERQAAGRRTQDTGSGEAKQAAVIAITAHQTRLYRHSPCHCQPLIVDVVAGGHLNNGGDEGHRRGGVEDEDLDLLGGAVGVQAPTSTSTLISTPGSSIGSSFWLWFGGTL